MKTIKLQAATPEQAEHLQAMTYVPGPVNILCKEIGARFEPGMETVAMLRAFVSILVGQVDEIKHWQQATAHLTKKAPSANAQEAINLAYLMLGQTEPEKMKEAAAAVHDFCHVANPDDAYPTDHIIDMISGCASAIRFGLETPCHSRHAAEAASHIWRLKYGVGLHDSFTGAWEHEWARAMLQRAMLLQISQAKPLADALRNLVWQARTSGGTAGHDEGLCAACEKAEATLSFHPQL